jgi:hypothetical protein
MKTLIKLSIGAALYAMSTTAAFAAEPNMVCGMGPGEPVTLSAAGISVSKSAMPAEELATTMATQLMQKQGYLNSICAGQTVASIRDGIMTGNNWKVGQLVDASKAVKLPLGRDVPAATASASKPAATMVSQEVVQPVPAAKPTDTPEVKAARAELASAQSALATARAKKADFDAVSASRGGVPGTMLTPAEKAGYDKVEADVARLKVEFTELEGKVIDLEKRMAATEGRIDKVEGVVLDKNGNATFYNKQEIDKKFDALPAGEGFPWWGWALIGFSILLGGLAVLFAAIAGSSKEAKLDLSGFATKEELEAVKVTVQSVKDQTDSVDIRFGAGQQEQLAALLEGETLPVDVFVEGEKKFKVRFKRIENGLFVFDEPKSRFKSLNPATPLKSPLSSVCRNYKRGEFAGSMLSAVPAAA